MAAAEPDATASGGTGLADAASSATASSATAPGVGASGLFAPGGGGAGDAGTGETSTAARARASSLVRMPSFRMPRFRWLRAVVAAMPSSLAIAWRSVPVASMVRTWASRGDSTRRSLAASGCSRAVVGVVVTASPGADMRDELAHNQIIRDTASFCRLTGRSGVELGP
ncbi:hypothetical protein UK12_08600 [Saccharothrix sp. ST-888]|nr:hypothetical protein UK12_08600 [Saccharothrix sp. ST-888]